MNSWIILDKPTGITSAHAVARVKRLLASSLRTEGEAIRLDNGDSGLLRRAAPHNDVKIGHAGTLDPLASGILPLALGEATKTIPYMMDASKTYAFTVAWGAETETDDLEGNIVKTSDIRPNIEQIQAILPQFIGEIDQMPPSYSAIKVGGKRAYELARCGQEVELKSRKVRVDSLALSPLEKEGRDGEIDADSAVPCVIPHPTFSLKGGGLEKTAFLCHCGKGTYIRSLARDMGRKLGCFGHITALRRLKVGSFDESQAISLELLEKMVHKGDLGFLRPITSALDDIPAVMVSTMQACRLRQGQAIAIPATEGPVQLLYEQELVAIGESRGGAVRPVRVFNEQ